MSTESPDTATGSERDDHRIELVDTDVHPWHVEDEIATYLPEQYKNKGIEVPGGQWSNPHDGYLGTARSDIGGSPGEHRELLVEQVFDDLGMDIGILNAGGVLLLGISPQFDYAHALAKAYNDWLIDKWLDYDDRLFGSLVIAPQLPEKAAAEIRRVGDHPRIKQVLMSSGSEMPYGRPHYWPIYEAAEEMGLPVGIHPGADGRGLSKPPSGAGHPRTFLEYHATQPCNYYGQVNSMVCEGVFVEYPDLQFVCIEGGFSWVPTLMWRLDKDWKGMRVQAPYLEKLPSKYIIENCYFGTQPTVEPENPDHLLQTFDMVQAEETLLFATDYPHWDTDDPHHSMPKLPDDVASAVYAENAIELYDLPATTAEL
jgi:predicted TIM-barrel fold metal-dependent hydrolase